MRVRLLYMLMSVALIVTLDGGFGQPAEAAGGAAAERAALPKDDRVKGKVYAGLRRGLRGSPCAENVRGLR